MMINVSEFIARAKKVPFLDRGRDYRGWDCWGLVCLMFQDCFGVTLPWGEAFTCRNPDEAMAQLMDGARQYSKVRSGYEKRGDILLFRPCHAGVVIRPGWLLNCRENFGTRLERYDNRVWQHQLIGIYRHAKFGSAL